MKFLITLFLFCGLSLSANAQIVRMETVLGNIDIELRPDVAPLTVANFLNYVNSGAYNGTIIHRSIHNFVIQGGGVKVTNGVFSNIIDNGTVDNEYSLANTRGTIAMAKPANNPNGASNQWFFNVIDNTETLGPNNQANAGSGGFTAFGSIISGIEIMDAISALPTSTSTNQITVTIDGQSFQATDLPYRNSFPSVYTESDAVIFQNMYVLDETLHINPGLNGLWSDTSVDGQGFLLEYFPNLNDNNGGMFAAWFTHDSVSTDSATAQLGDINQRWLSTNIGSINHETNTVSFLLSSVSGGVFNTPTAQSLPRSIIGTMTMKFNDCSNAVVNYNLTTPVLTGSINVTRIVNDNVALCENLSRQAATSR